MEEKLIKFDTAVLAKEKGFDVPVIDYYMGSKRSFTSSLPENHNREPISKEKYSRPSQSLLQRWLREVHQIHIDIRWYCSFDDESEIKNIPEDIFFRAEVMNCAKRTIGYKTKYDKQTLHNKTYEEALEKALLFGLNLIKKLVD